MKRCGTAIGLGLLFFFGAPAPSGARPQLSPAPSVSKATATVELIPGKPMIIVRVENLSDVVIEAWHYTITYDVGSGPLSMEVAIDGGLDPDAPGGSIPPRSMRNKVLALAGIPVRASAAVVMVMLSDGTYEGRTDDRHAVLRTRERRASVLDLWIEALRAVAGKPGREAKSELERIRDSDRRYLPDRADAWAMAIDMNLKELLSNSDPDQLPLRLSTLLEQFRVQRERALRHAR